MTAALDRSDLAHDDRFASEGARLANDDALVTALADVFATRAAGEWEHLLTAAGVACVQAFEASHSEFTCTDPVLRETGLVVEVDHPAFDKILRAGPPVAMSETPGRAAGGCLVGQHTDQILEELGYSAEQVEELKTKQVVFGRAADDQLTPAHCSFATAASCSANQAS